MPVDFIYFMICALRFLVSCRKRIFCRKGGVSKSECNLEFKL